MSRSPSFAGGDDFSARPSEAEYPTRNTPDRHAFVIVGTEHTFLCHQVMGFMENHSYECVLEVRLLSEAVKDRLIRDREEPGRTHFWANKDEKCARFSIPEVRNTGRRVVQGDVWTCMPSAPKPPWSLEPAFKDVDLEILRVVHCRHLDVGTSQREFENYLVFGKGGEAHVYHAVRSRRDYDHVATLQAVPEWLSRDQLEVGVSVDIVDLPLAGDGSPRPPCQDPMEEKRPYRVLYHGLRAYPEHPGQDPDEWSPVPDYFIRPAKTWWFSTRIVNLFVGDPCGDDVKEIPPPCEDGG